MISDHLWTCPECGGTVPLPDPPPERDQARRDAQLTHGLRHRAAGRYAPFLPEALAAALADEPHGRIMVNPRDAERLRFEIARRRARVVVCESLAVQVGRGVRLSPVDRDDRRGTPR